MCGFEPSGLVLDFAAAGTAHVAEQIAFEVMFGVTGTVHSYERAFGASTPSMDLMRKNVLAGATFTGEKNRRVTGGGALRLLQQSLHHGIVRFEQGNEIVSGARYRTIQISAFFVHRRRPIQKSVLAFKPDNVDTKTLGAAQQIGTNRAPK